MCIEITGEKKFFERPFEAWKVLGKRHNFLGKPIIIVTGPFSQTPLKRGKWLKAKYEPEEKLYVPPKWCGFTVFENKEDAQRYYRKNWYQSTPPEKVKCRGWCTPGFLSNDYHHKVPVAYVEEVMFFIILSNVS